MRFVDYGVFYKDIHQVSLEYAARHARELGFDAVELLEVFPLKKNAILWKYPAHEMRRVLEEYGLSVSCVSFGVNLAEDEIDWDGIEALIEYAAAVGSPRVHHTLVPLVSLQEGAPSYETMLERVYPHAVKIANRCRMLGMECLYEPQGIYFNGTEGLGHFYDRICAECTNVGICGDTGNSLFVDISAEAIYDRFVHGIRHVHVKNYRVTDAPDGATRAYRSKGGRYIYDCPIERGATDLAYCLEKLKAVGYDGDISFEMEIDDCVTREAMTYLRGLWEKEN